MPIPLPVIDPFTHQLTSAARKYLKELLQAQYLSRFIKYPPLYFPVPESFPPEPEPQPNISLQQSIQQSVVGELLIHALTDPTPQPGRLSIVNDIKKEKLDMEVIEELITQFEGGITILKKELTSIRKCH